MWFYVYLNDKKIDEVSYDDHPAHDAESVKRSLIDHDGYDSGIEVVKHIKDNVLIDHALSFLLSNIDEYNEMQEETDDPTIDGRLIKDLLENQE